LPGWTINPTCTGGTGTCSSVVTDVNGNYAIYPTGPIASYSVCETGQAGYTQVYPNASTPVNNGATASAGCWNGVLGTAAGTGLDFGNNIQLSGLKFYDVNVSGTKDASESGIAGFKISITYCTTGTTCSAGTTTTLLTGAGGTFTWTAPVVITSFNVCE